MSLESVSTHSAERGRAAGAHLLVIHGALGSAEQMQPVAEALSVLGAVTNVELPGHGRTPRGDATFTIAGYGRWLEPIVRNARSGSSELYVFGYSMGGYIALACESQHAGSFAGIVTLGTKFAWTPDLAAGAARRLDPDTIAAKVPAFAAALRSRHEGSGGWHENLAGTRGLLTDLGADPPLVHDTLRQIESVVALAVGSNDDTVDASETCEMARLIPAGECRVLDDVPHPIERVAPARVVELVREVMTRGASLS